MCVHSYMFCVCANTHIHTLTLKSLTHPNTRTHNITFQDPYRTFEAYLRKYQPAVGFPFNGYGFPDPPVEVHVCVFMCACM